MISIYVLYIFAFLSGCSSSDVPDDVTLEKPKETTVLVSDSNKDHAEIKQEKKIEKQELHKDLISEGSTLNSTEKMETKDNQSKEDVGQKEKLVQKIEKKIKKESSMEMGEVELFANLDIHFSGVAPIFQNYFYETGL